VPFLLNKRSMVVIGEYLSYSNFSWTMARTFRWPQPRWRRAIFIRCRTWQLLGAVAPFYNHSSIGEQGKDYWQVMGGALARYTRNERLWWLFGVVFDDSDFGTTWLPLRRRLTDSQ